MFQTHFLCLKNLLFAIASLLSLPSITAVSIESIKGGKVLSTKKNKFFGSYLINCGGLYSDKLAKLDKIDELILYRLAKLVRLVRLAILVRLARLARLAR